MNEEINKLILKGKSIAEFVLREFGALNAVELNRKPDDRSWSIGQCLHHVIVSDSTYFPSLRSVSDGSHKPGFWQRINPLTKITGKNMIATLGPVVRKKFKAPKIFQPSSTPVSQSIPQDFANHMHELLVLMGRLEDLPVGKIVVSSPVSPLITLTVYDVLQILVAHAERHVQQAMRIRKRVITD